MTATNTRVVRPSSARKVINAIDYYRNKNIVPTVFEIALAADLSTTKVKSILRYDAEVQRLVKKGFVARSYRGTTPAWAANAPKTPLSSRKDKIDSYSLVISQKISNPEIKKEADLQIQMYTEALSRTKIKPSKQMRMAQEFANARTGSAKHHDETEQRIKQLEQKLTLTQSREKALLALGQTVLGNLSDEDLTAVTKLQEEISKNPTLAVIEGGK